MAGCEFERPPRRPKADNAPASKVPDDRLHRWVKGPSGWFCTRQRCPGLNDRLAASSANPLGHRVVEFSHHLGDFSICADCGRWGTRSAKGLFKRAGAPTTARTAQSWNKVFSKGGHPNHRFTGYDRSHIDGFKLPKHRTPFRKLAGVLHRDCWKRRLRGKHKPWVAASVGYTPSDGPVIVRPGPPQPTADHASVDGTLVQQQTHSSVSLPPDHFDLAAGGDEDVDTLIFDIHEGPPSEVMGPDEDVFGFACLGFDDASDDHNLVSCFSDVAPGQRLQQQPPQQQQQQQQLVRQQSAISGNACIDDGDQAGPAGDAEFDTVNWMGKRLSCKRASWEYSQSPDMDRHQEMSFGRAQRKLVRHDEQNHGDGVGKRMGQQPRAPVDDGRSFTTRGDSCGPYHDPGPPERARRIQTDHADPFAGDGNAHVDDRGGISSSSCGTSTSARDLAPASDWIDSQATVRSSLSHTQGYCGHDTPLEVADVCQDPMNRMGHNPNSGERGGRAPPYVSVATSRCVCRPRCLTSHDVG